MGNQWRRGERKEGDRKRRREGDDGRGSFPALLTRCWIIHGSCLHCSRPHQRHSQLMASIWSSHLLPSLPLTTLRSLPTEECLPPDLPTLLPLTRCCHQGDWCMRHLSPRHYCQVSMTQDKGAGIYLRQRRAPLMWGPQDVLEMRCRDTQTFCTSSAWVQQGLLALAQHQPRWTWAASQQNHSSVSTWCFPALGVWEGLLAWACCQTWAAFLHLYSAWTKRPLQCSEHSGKTPAWL